MAMNYSVLTNYNNDKDHSHSKLRGVKHIDLKILGRNCDLWPVNLILDQERTIYLTCYDRHVHEN